MKKILFIAMATTAILASCSKTTENATIPNVPADDGPQVQITLTDENPGSRAYFGDTAVAETWESEIKTLTVYVCDNSGNVILRRKISQAEITAKSARLILPNSTQGTTCSFYAVANEDYGNFSNITNLNGRTEKLSLDQYNGTFAETANARKRSAGFVMTGKTSSLIAAAGGTTSIGVTLKRVVAKIAVRASQSYTFSSIYNNGRVVITSATLSQAQGESYSFPNANVYNPGVGTFSHTQTSDVSGIYFRHMFYAYENAASAREEDRPKLVLSGYFDADGNNTTTNDRSDVSYVIYLEGNRNGEISRNGYYRVEASIKGIYGDEVIVTFTVANWETPATQTLDLGV